MSEPKIQKEFYFPVNGFDVRMTGDEVYLRMGVAIWHGDGSTVEQAYTAVMSYPAFRNMYAMLVKMVEEHEELQASNTIPIIHGFGDVGENVVNDDETRD